MRRCLHIRWNARIAAAAWMIPRLRQGQEAHCPVCNHEIVEVENNPYIAPIAYALTTLILMAFAYNMVYIRVDFVRRGHQFCRCRK